MQIRLPGGHYVRYYQDAPNAVCHDVPGLTEGMVSVCKAHHDAITAAVNTGNTQSVDGELRSAISVMKSLAQVSQRHAPIAEKLTDAHSVLTFLQVPQSVLLLLCVSYVCLFCCLFSWRLLRGIASRNSRRPLQHFNWGLRWRSCRNVTLPRCHTLALFWLACQRYTCLNET